MNRARRFGRNMTRNAAGKGELFEELLQPGFVLSDVWIDLAVSAFEVSITDHCRTSMPRAGDVDHVEILRFDDTIQVRIDEVLPRRRAPVPEQHVLDVRERERTLQQWIIREENLPHREVIGSTPVGIDALEKVGRQGVGFHGCYRISSGVFMGGLQISAVRSARLSPTPKPPGEWCRRR